MNENISKFNDLDIRIGTIVEASAFPEARKPAYKLRVDFGTQVGVLKTSAQITEQYEASALEGKQVLGLINLEPRQIGSFMSEFLILGVYSQNGVVLLSTDKPCENGDKVG